MLHVAPKALSQRKTGSSARRDHHDARHGPLSRTEWVHSPEAQTPLRIQVAALEGAKCCRLDELAVAMAERS